MLARGSCRRQSARAVRNERRCARAPPRRKLTNAHVVKIRLTPAHASFTVADMLTAVVQHGRVPRRPVKDLPPEGPMHLGVRVDVELIRKLDAEAKHMEAERPGMRVSRTDAVQVLLHEALAA